MLDLRRLRTDLFALGLLAGLVYVGLALFTFDPADPPSKLVLPAHVEVENLVGRYGAIIAYHAHMTFGVGCYVLFAGLIVVDLQLFSRGASQDRLLRFIGGLLLIAAICGGLQLAWPDLGSSLIYGSGGYVGAVVHGLLDQHFTMMGCFILLMTAAGVGALLAADGLVLFAGSAGAGWFSRQLEPREVPIKENTAAAAAAGTAVATNSPRFAVINGPPRPADESADDDDAGNADTEEPISIALPSNKQARVPFRVNPPGGTAAEAEPGHAAALRVIDEEEAEAEYIPPHPGLLDPAEAFPYEALAERAQQAAATLERSFQDFGLNVKVVEIDTGPVVTQFELELEAGLRLSRIASLADDLAIALRVPSVRVVAPIPGKNTVGIEVPNDIRVMVRLRELLEARADAAEKKMAIPIYIGKDVSGHPMVVDLTKMPHLLIAGRTGTGKSVCLNTLILSILMCRRPDEVKMLMIDPKMVELSPYMRVPHLMHPVITDMKKAEAVLGWAVEKMEERYDLLARCGVRHLDSYNKLGHENVLDRLGIDPDSPEADEVPEKMPYIVIVADEMADMMMTSGKEVEASIIRLAQKSRAVGIHLVLATQKPTVDVITGLIKSNLPARIAFQVASRTDSRVVLDEMGAEKLLGNGDMLYLAPGTSNVTRAQGTFVSDDEVTTIIDYLSTYEPQYSEELARLKAAPAAGKSGASADRAKDDLYHEAVEIVIREGRGSTSLLQRALGIGYGRAARLIDYMSEDGIVGDYNGSQARDVLMTIDDWEASLTEA